MFLLKNDITYIGCAIFITLIAALYALSRPAPENCRHPAWSSFTGDGDALTCHDAGDR